MCSQQSLLLWLIHRFMFHLFKNPEKTLLNDSPYFVVCDWWYQTPVAYLPFFCAFSWNKVRLMFCSVETTILEEQPTHYQQQLGHQSSSQTSVCHTGFTVYCIQSEYCITIHWVLCIQSEHSTIIRWVINMQSTNTMTIRIKILCVIKSRMQFTILQYVIWSEFSAQIWNTLYDNNKKSTHCITNHSIIWIIVIQRTTCTLKYSMIRALYVWYKYNTFSQEYSP